MTTVSVSPKFQITLVEEVRKHFPGLKPGDKLVVSYDPNLHKITVAPEDDWKRFAGILKGKTQVPFKSIEEEKAAIEASRKEYYSEKYGRSRH